MRGNLRLTSVLAALAATTGCATTALTVGDLPAVLTVPERERYPAVVLVHGSGSSDGDATIGPNKPFRDIAEGLAARGVATLRYDKRTHHAPDLAERDDFTLKRETVDDAVEAIALLERQPRVTCVFALGHSLGGTAMPRVAARSPRARGFVIMAGSTQPLEDSVLAQMRHVSELDGAISDSEQHTLDDLATKVARVKQLSAQPVVGTAKRTDFPLSLPQSYWRDLQQHDTTALLENEHRPFLVLHGERDYQVTRVDFEGWQVALTGNPNATFKSYPSLNHLFMPGTGPSAPTEYAHRGHISPTVLDDLAAWFATHCAM